MVFGGGGGKLVVYWGPDAKPGPFTWYCGSGGPGGAMSLWSVKGFSIAFAMGGSCSGGGGGRFGEIGIAIRGQWRKWRWLFSTCRDI